MDNNGEDENKEVILCDNSREIQNTEKKVSDAFVDFFIQPATGQAIRNIAQKLTDHKTQMEQLQMQMLAIQQKSNNDRMSFEQQYAAFKPGIETMMTCIKGHLAELQKMDVTKLDEIKSKVYTKLLDEMTKSQLIVLKLYEDLLH